STFQMVEPVWTDVHLEIQIPRPAAAGTGLALARQANELPIGHSGRNGDPDRVACELERTVAFELGALEVERARRRTKPLLPFDLDPCVMVPALAVPSSRCERPAGAKQRGKEIAEAFALEGFLLRAGRAAKLEAAAPIRRRLELLARLPLAAELVV